MREDFILPDIGEGIVECELVEWLVEEGDSVVEDQPVADVQTDKALVQIPAKHAGLVVKRYVEQGEIARVHAPLFALEIADESPVTTNEMDDKARSESTEAAQPVAQTGYEEDFILPDIGEGIVECELVEWLVEEGDTVTEDQPVADVQTDKALVQIPAKHAGRVVKRYVEQGEIAKVHSPLFRLALSDSEGHAPTTPAVAQPKAPEAVTQTRQNISSTDENRRKVLATPAVRRIARQHDIELGSVPASGKNGRVLKEDMLRFLGELEDKPASGTKPAAPEKTGTTATRKSDVEVIPVKGMRAAMARQMTHSAQTIPHFTYSEEIDVTELTRLRRSLNQRLESQGVKLTVMSLFIKSLSLALKRHPIVNSHMSDAGDEIHQFADHNIGMAVDSPQGLLVPNIKGVQKLSLLGLASEIKRLTEAGRAGRLSPDDLKGGTITVSNIGSIGGTVTTPIVNAPEVAIVGIGRLQRLPRPNNNDELEIRDIIQVSWSGDHRVLDGGTIARFCNDWKAMLEQPNDMVLWMV